MFVPVQSFSQYVIQKDSKVKFHLWLNALLIYLNDSGRDEQENSITLG